MAWSVSFAYCLQTWPGRGGTFDGEFASTEAIVKLARQIVNGRRSLPPEARLSNPGCDGLPGVSLERSPGDVSSNRLSPRLLSLSHP